jgi:predicted TIM-barrel fold metal-dependent hydrolase
VASIVLKIGGIEAESSKELPMRDGMKIVDTDCHQMEPAKMWAEYITPRYRSEAPAVREIASKRVMAVEDESLTSEDKYPFSTPDFLAAMARGMERFEATRKAGFSATSRLADMDREGVDAQVIYPTVGGQLLGREFRDTALLAACCRAYNRWSAEYCSADSKRLRWAAMLPFQDVELAIEEARHAAAAGAAGFYVRPNPVAERNLYHPDHEPLWAAIENLDRPVCIHDSGSPHLPSYGERMDTHTTGHILAHPFEAMSAMMSLIWYGIFERHPGLTVVHVEADAGWLPYLLQRMDQHWEFSGNAEHPDLKMHPTEYFRRNVFVACRGDEMTLPSAVDLVGDDNIVFNTDYPHPDGTWPWGMERLRAQDISEASKRKILWDNAARAFHLDG